MGVSLILERGRSGFVLHERTVGRDGFFQDNLGFGVRIEFQVKAPLPRPRRERAMEAT